MLKFWFDPRRIRGVSSVLNAFLIMRSEDTAPVIIFFGTLPNSEKSERSGLRGAGRGRFLRLRFLSFFRCLGRRLLQALGI